MAERNTDPLSLGDVLKRFVEHNRLDKGLTRIEARDAWVNLMGAGVNRYTTEVVLRDDTLFVSLSSSVLREELSFGKEKIITMLNEELGKEVIKKLVLR